MLQINEQRKIGSASNWSRLPIFTFSQLSKTGLYIKTTLHATSFIKKYQILRSVPGLTETTDGKAPGVQKTSFIASLLQ